MLAVLRIGVWLAQFRRPFLLLAGSRMATGREFALASTLFCVYGLLAIAVVSRRSSQYEVKRSTLLGLGSPAV
jgi:hypothetical protein